MTRLLPPTSAPDEHNLGPPFLASLPPLLVVLVKPPLSDSLVPPRIHRRHHPPLQPLDLPPLPRLPQHPPQPHLPLPLLPIHKHLHLQLPQRAPLRQRAQHLLDVRRVQPVVPQPRQAGQGAGEGELLLGDRGERRELVDEGVGDVEGAEGGEGGGAEGGEGGERGGGGEVEGEGVEVGSGGEEGGGVGRGGEGPGGEVECVQVGKWSVFEIDLDSAEGETLERCGREMSLDQPCRRLL